MLILLQNVIYHLTSLKITVLLSFACGLDIGNINHNKILIGNFLELVDKELVKKTAEWFYQQTSITTTLLEQKLVFYCLQSYF